jgi:hypothetical protein
MSQQAGSRCLQTWVFRSRTRGPGRHIFRFECTCEMATQPDRERHMRVAERLVSGADFRVHI